MAWCIYKQIIFLMNYFLTNRCVHVIVGLWYFMPILLQIEGIMKDQPITTWDIIRLIALDIIMSLWAIQTIISLTLCLTT